MHWAHTHEEDGWASWDQHPFNNTGRTTYGTADGLYDEVSEIVGTIVEKAKQAGTQRNIFLTDVGLTEFGYMCLVFLCKASLYFLLKSGYEKGYENINL